MSQVIVEDFVPLQRIFSVFREVLDSCKMPWATVLGAKGHVGNKVLALQIIMSDKCILNNHKG